MITIFANMKINSKEKLQYLKDSFHSFSSVSDNWLINIRGAYRGEALAFLREALGNKMVEFDLLDDKKGWSVNAQIMLAEAKYEYLFVWLEDHINLAPVSIYPLIVKEMSEKKVDYMMYTWWLFGAARKGINMPQLQSGTHIDTLSLTKETWKTLQSQGFLFYLVSLCGIFHKNFFSVLLDLDQKNLPHYFSEFIKKCISIVRRIMKKVDPQKAFYFMNKIFHYRLPTFSKETPFNIEKHQSRVDILPFVVAFPKQELFACIDDDLGHPGYQLKSRGLYPIK